MAKYTDEWVTMHFDTVNKDGVLCYAQKRRNPETNKLEERLHPFTPQELTERIKELEAQIDDMNYQRSYDY